MPTLSVGATSSRQRFRRGVTLIELLIVMTLIALVVGVSYPSAAAGIGRRPLIKRTLGAALGLAGLSPLLLLRDLGPLPGKKLEETSWKAGTRLVTDPGNQPIKASLNTTP